MSAFSRTTEGLHRVSAVSNYRDELNPDKVKAKTEAARVERERLAMEQRKLDELASAERKARLLADQPSIQEARLLQQEANKNKVDDMEDALCSAMFESMTLSCSTYACEQPEPMTVPEPTPAPVPVTGRKAEDDKKQIQFVGLTTVQTAFCLMLNTVMSRLLITLKIQEEIRDKEEDGAMPFVNLQKFLDHFPKVLLWLTMSKTSALKKHLKVLTDEDRAQFENLTAQDAEWIIRNAQKCMDDHVIKAYSIENGNIRHNNKTNEISVLPTFVSAPPAVLQERKIVTARRSVTAAKTSSGAAGMDLA
jgi:hypothetical protein